MINGVYKFKLGDDVIYEQKNALTTMGRSIAIKSLLGIIPNFAGAISYGIGQQENTLDSTTNLISNNTLQFEVGRSEVIGSSLDLSESSDILVYTAVINDPNQYTIYEVGLFPGGIANLNVDLSGSTMFDFDRVDLFNKFGTASAAALLNATEARIGSQLFSLPDTDGADSYLTYSSTDGTMSAIDNYTSEDLFKLAGLDFNEFSASINFRFYTDTSNYYDYTFTTPTASGYFVVETQKNTAAITGVPSWSNITSVKIWQNSGSAVYLDALKIDYGSYYQDNITGMISRAVLAEPVRKPSGIPLTIEYSLSVGFNQI